MKDADEGAGVVCANVLRGGVDERRLDLPGGPRGVSLFDQRCSACGQWSREAGARGGDIAGGTVHIAQGIEFLAAHEDEIAIEPAAGDGEEIGLDAVQSKRRS